MGVEVYIFNNNRLKLLEIMKTTENNKLHRVDFTDLEWFNKMKELGEDLPNEYCDIFDRNGEFSEEYEDIMTVDLYIINTENSVVENNKLIAEFMGREYIQTQRGKAIIISSNERLVEATYCECCNQLTELPHTEIDKTYQEILNPDYKGEATIINNELFIGNKQVYNYGVEKLNGHIPRLLIIRSPETWTTREGKEVTSSRFVCGFDLMDDGKFWLGAAYKELRDSEYFDTMEEVDKFLNDNGYKNYVIYVEDEFSL